MRGEIIERFADLLFDEIDYVLKAVFSDAHSEVRSFESGNTGKR